MAERICRRATGRCSACWGGLWVGTFLEIVTYQGVTDLDASAELGTLLGAPRARRTSKATPDLATLASPDPRRASSVGALSADGMTGSVTHQPKPA
jgi:hypothetical protein